jgi:cellulose synthase (UDP-forming)
MSATRLTWVRIITVLALLAGVVYLVWRWGFSLNWHYWWVSVPLVLAETYAVIGTALIGLQAWRIKQRTVAPPPPSDATVDVFIATYNESIDLVLTTAKAARDMDFPHSTYVLDDGARPEMEAAATEAGIGYITRGAEWLGKNRHAKAGNINNALQHTTGEFIYVLDADMVPCKDLITKTLGWFTDEKIAIVQTPQWYYNVTEGDPLANQQPLFFGPMLQGKDGWGGAIFAGTNGALRREALMQLGIKMYVDATEAAVVRALKASEKIVGKALKHPAGLDDRTRTALEATAAAAADGLKRLKTDEPVQTISWDFQEAVRKANASVVATDLSSIQADIDELRELGLDYTSVDDNPTDADAPNVEVAVLNDAALEALTSMDVSPLAALHQVSSVVRKIDVDRSGEALAINPVSSESITEDMETSMMLHSLGWKSLYHHEVLSQGMGVEDLQSYITQRGRWCQGNMQVLLKHNPLTMRGLKGGQRLSYFAMLWDYLGGFASLIFFAVPLLYLLLGALPVRHFGWTFVLLFLPMFLLQMVLVQLIGKGARTSRDRKITLAMFPSWISGCVSAAANVWFKRPLHFSVTPKDNVSDPNRPFPWKLTWPQITIMGLQMLAIVFGFGLLMVNAGQYAFPSLNSILHFGNEVEWVARAPWFVSNGISWFGWAVNAAWIAWYWYQLLGYLQAAGFTMPKYDFHDYVP